MKFYIEVESNSNVSLNISIDPGVCCLDIDLNDMVCGKIMVLRPPVVIELDNDPVKINGSPVFGLIDTGCTTSVVHPKCVKPKANLSWKIPYCTASSRKVHFPTAKVTLTIEGKSYDIGNLYFEVFIYYTNYCWNGSTARGEL